MKNSNAAWEITTSTGTYDDGFDVENSLATNQFDAISLEDILAFDPDSIETISSYSISVSPTLSSKA